MISTLCKQIKQYKRETHSRRRFGGHRSLPRDILIPFLMSKMVNEGVNTGDMAVVWNYGLLMPLCAVGALITGGLSGNTQRRFRRFCQKPARRGIPQHSELLVFQY